MDQLKQLLARLSWNQRIWIGAAVLAVLGGLYSLNRWNQERDFKPLLTGLAPEDAGTVTAKLKELGVDYRLADGGLDHPGSVRQACGDAFAISLGRTPQNRTHRV